MRSVQISKALLSLRKDERIEETTRSTMEALASKKDSQAFLRKEYYGAQADRGKA